MGRDQQRRAIVKTLLSFASFVVFAGVVLSPAASAPSANRFSVHQEPRGIGNLVAPGDRVTLVYDAGVKSATGSVFVRNDLQRAFVRLPLGAERGPASTYRARVPARLIRGHKLLYYAVMHDKKSGRSARVPAAGARAPSSAWILEQPVVVNLGRHQFGQTRVPEAVVARARADQVGWQIHDPSCGCGPSFGPQSFLVGQDRSVWLHDSLNDRMLVWNPDAPDTIVRSVPLPPRSSDNDVALGPAGTIYVTGGIGHGLSFRWVLYHLSPTGEVLWRSRVAADLQGSRSFLVAANSLLRVGPDRTLFLLVGMPGLPGGEQGWMPVATPAGRPLSVPEQRRRTHWPYQPVAGGLRLLSEVYTPPGAETAPHEARYALIDRRGRLVRAWRVVSRTDMNSISVHTAELVGGDPVVVIDFVAETGGQRQWEYEVLRLGPHGTRARFSLSRAVFGDNILSDIRVGPDGKLYELGSSPTTGVAISRYSLGSQS
jgi:hypothetical protein